MPNKLKTISDVADARAMEMYKKQEMSKINKAIHAFGGEARVFDRIASGQTVLALCNEIGVVTARFYEWANKSAERAETLARAREAGAHSMVDETQQIVDSATVDEVPLAKLRAENRWRMAKAFNRGAYGDAQPTVQINLGDLALDSLRRRSVSVNPVNELDDRIVDNLG